MNKNNKLENKINNKTTNKNQNIKLNFKIQNQSSGGKASKTLPLS